MKHKVLKTPIIQLNKDNPIFSSKQNYIYNFINISNQESFTKHKSQENYSNNISSPKCVFRNTKDKNFYITAANNKKSENKYLTFNKDQFNITSKQSEHKNSHDLSKNKLKNAEHSSFQDIYQKLQIPQNKTKTIVNYSKSHSPNEKFSKTKQIKKNVIINNITSSSDSFESFQKIDSLDTENKINSTKNIKFKNLKNIQNKKNRKIIKKESNEKKNKPQETININNDEDTFLVTDNEFETNKSLNKNNFFNETKILKLSSNPFFEQSVKIQPRRNSPPPSNINNCFNNKNNKINSSVNIINNSKENFTHHIKSSTIQVGSFSKCEPKNILIKTISSKTNSITTNLNSENTSTLGKKVLNQKNLRDKSEILALYQKFLSIAKRGDKEKFLQILSKIYSLPKEYININYKDVNGYSALHFACDEGNYKIVEILLKSNCEPNLKNNEEKTGLHLSSQHGYFDISKLLIENGALLNIKDSEKNTPLHYVCMNNHIELLNYYLTKLPQADQKNIYGKTPYDLTNNIEIKKILENYLNNNQNQYHNIKIHESSNSNLKSLMKNYSNNEKYKSNMNIIDNDKLNQIYVNTPNYNTLTRTKTFLENLIPNKRSSPECIIREDKKFKKDQFFSQKIKPKVNKYNNNATNNSNLNKSSKNNLMIKSKQKSNKIILNSCLKSSKENPTVNNLNISSLSVKKKSNNIISSASDKKLPEARLKKKSANKNRKQENNSLQKTKKIMQEFSTLENNNNTYISNGTLASSNLNPFTITNDTCINVNIDYSKLNNSNLIYNKKKNNDSKNKIKTKNLKNSQCNKKNKKKENSLITSKNNYSNIIKNYNTIGCKTTNINNNFNNINKININEILDSIKPKNINKRKKQKNNSFSDKIITSHTENKKYSNDNIDTKINTTNNDTINLFSNLNLNSIEEEKISLTSFICLALLGKGSFGEVYLVEKIDTKENYAMKVLRKEKIMGQNLLKYAMAERNVLSVTNHPFIVKLHFAFQTNTKLFLIMEYCAGGDLSKHLYFEKRFSEERAKFYLCEVLLGLEYLHKRDIIFRDLKPDNVVLDEKGYAKLTDFGMSKEGVYDSQSANSFCGSVAYLAPEVLKKQGHGKAVDWYLLGVLFYEMIVGIPPFFGNNQQNIFYNIEYGELLIPNFVSKNAEDLLRKLLERDPNKRLGGGRRDAVEIKEHVYFKDVNWDKVYKKEIIPPKMNNYNNKPIKTYQHPKIFAKDETLNINKNKLIGWSFINNEDL